MKPPHDLPSLSEVHRSVPVPTSGNWLRRMFAFAGPAYLVSVGYMDPGNWATDLQGGARFGYQLVWVLLMSNLMAVLLQTLSARLGLVTRAATKVEVLPSLEDVFIDRVRGAGSPIAR